MAISPERETQEEDVPLAIGAGEPLASENLSIWQQTDWNSEVGDVAETSPLFPLPRAETLDLGEVQPESESSEEEFNVFPVGLNVGRRNVIQSVLVRGQEDGLEAVDFENWLIPYDAVIQALKLEVTPLSDSQIEVRSPGLVTRLDLSQLRDDPELGLVFSIQDLSTLFGVSAEFNINEYAIALNPTWLGQTTATEESTQIVQLEGLPRIKPQSLTLTAIEQQVNTTGSPDSSLNYQGELAAVGTFLEGSWYTRVNQADLRDSRTWNLAEAQYLRQSETADYVIGSQSTFWRTQGSSDYWGFTSIHRQGFAPMPSFGGFSPGQRLQASQVGRTIVGEAEPGTLVRLTEGFSDRILAEVLVDSSGVYRFEDVTADGQSPGNYRVLLYPEGRLSAQPEIREATFSTVPGQIPAGATATILSGGFRREAADSESPNLIGRFGGFRGGIARRWGLSENLTAGIGGVYDEVPRGLGEVFFKPSGIPLEIAASLLTPDADGTWDVETNIRYNPTSSLSAQFSRDRFAERFDFNWRALPGITVIGTYNSRDNAAVGIQTTWSAPHSFTLARATLDSDNRLRWNLTQRWGSLEFNQQRSDIGLRSQLNYNLSGSNLLSRGHSLFFSYETRTINNRDDLATLGWRFRSPTRTKDGTYRWEAELAYGTGSQGSGFVATVQTAVLPGLLLRGRYEGISVTSNEAQYRLELATSLNLQRGISPGDRQADRFRTRGGLLIQPFFDRNANGQRDAGEDYYTENADLLFLLNNRPLKLYRPEVRRDRILLRLPADTYRLDLDPAGLPLDWQAMEDAYAVEVVAGSYTPVPLPLIQSYTLSGVVVDDRGNPVAGARVEAIGQDTGQRRFSVTNGAGVYFLERLLQGTFDLQVNGEPAQPATITLDADSEAFQELNLVQP